MGIIKALMPGEDDDDGMKTVVIHPCHQIQPTFAGHFNVSQYNIDIFGTFENLPGLESAVGSKLLFNSETVPVCIFNNSLHNIILIIHD